MGDRFVVLGLARARAEWFRSVGHWASSAMIAAEFVRCVSLDELRARLRSGRQFSAVLVDGSVPGLDRDTIAEAVERGVAVLVVDAEARRDWSELGAAAVLATRFSRDELLELLEATARRVGAAVLDESPAIAPTYRHGTLFAVTGPGGTGASVLAIALAQALARGDGRAGDRREALPRVLLADLCRAADQAMLHDARVVVPSIQEIVEAHRTSIPSRQPLEQQTFEVPARGYRLLLGLRRPRHWVSLRPRALERALVSLLGLVDVVVADVDADVEGRGETGSVDVEERNALARIALSRADVVLVVLDPSMKGTFSGVRVIDDLVGFGVPVERILPVFNRAPRRPSARAELQRALGNLVTASLGDGAVRPGPAVFVPERAVDRALWDGVALPSSVGRTLAQATETVLVRAAPRVGTAAGELPTRIPPGSLGGFTAGQRPAS